MLDKDTIIIVNKQGEAEIKEVEEPKEGGFPWWLLAALVILGRACSILGT